MSQPGNSVRYLTGDAAKDVSTMLDIPWYYTRVETGGPRVPYLALETQWDGFRASWCIVAMYSVIARYGTACAVGKNT